MTYEEKYNVLAEEDIATDEEISLVCRINGFTEEQLENILYIRTGYTSFESYKHYEIDRFVGDDFDDEEYENFFLCFCESAEF